MTEYEYFVQALNAYDAKNEKEAFDYYPYLFYFTGNNALWQLQILSKLNWKKGKYQKSVLKLAKDIYADLPEDVLCLEEVKELGKEFGIK